jgi:glycerol kinase
VNEGHVLAIDEGTTNAKAVLVDRSGRVIKRPALPLSVSFPRTAWVEQDADAIWQSVQSVAAECAQAAEIAAIGISNQRETVVLWERESGRPLGPAVVWQCQRGAPLCRELRGAGMDRLVRERSGLTLDPMFSASKMRWLLDNTPDGVKRAQSGELCLGTVDSWILYHLTGGETFACDTTNASRTLLVNIRELDWDPELCDVFGIPMEALPSIRPSSSLFGHTAGICGLPDGIPITSLIGDSHAALFGHAGFGRGSIKATYGTGTSLMTPVNEPIESQHGLSTTVAWSIGSGTTYALEGNIYISGAVVPWVGRLLGVEDAVQAVNALARTVNSTEGVYLVPAFVGLGAPHWSDSARGIITGLTQATTPAHVARASLEAIAYQIRDIFDAMQAEASAPLNTVLADGGASRNDALMQFQADILGCPVLRNTSAEVSALGAAYLAGLAAGVWSSTAEIAELPRDQDEFVPQMDDAERNRLYAGWQKAVAQAVL